MNFKFSKTLKILTLIILLLVFVFFYFNMSFSLPKNFSEFIKGRTTTEIFEEIDKIRVQKSSWIENGHLMDPEDDREFIIDDESEIYFLLNKDVLIYEGGRYLRDPETEYEIFLYFNNGNTHRYHINEKYIISRETSDSEEHVFLTVLSDNEIYNYLIDLYK